MSEQASAKEWRRTMYGYITKAPTGDLPSESPPGYTWYLGTDAAVAALNALEADLATARGLADDLRAKYARELPLL